MVASMQVRLAYRSCHFSYSCYHYDRGAATREIRDSLGVRQRRCALAGVGRGWLRRFLLLPLGLLLVWVPFDQHCFHHFSPGRYRLPVVHAFLELAVHKALRTLWSDEGSLFRRVLQRLSASDLLHLASFPILYHTRISHTHHIVLCFGSGLFVHDSRFTTFTITTTTTHFI